MTKPDERTYPLTPGMYRELGLTKREWFAGMLISSNGVSCEEAVRLADVLIAELNKGEKVG